MFVRCHESMYFCPPIDSCVLLARLSSAICNTLSHAASVDSLLVFTLHIGKKEQRDGACEEAAYHYMHDKLMKAKTVKLAPILQCFSPAADRHNLHVGPCTSRRCKVPTDCQAGSLLFCFSDLFPAMSFHIPRFWQPHRH